MGTLLANTTMFTYLLLYNVHGVAMRTEWQQTDQVLGAPLVWDKHPIVRNTNPVPQLNTLLPHVLYIKQLPRTLPEADSNIATPMRVANPYPPPSTKVCALEDASGPHALIT